MDFNTLHLPDPNMPLAAALVELEHAWLPGQRDHAACLNPGISEDEVRQKLFQIDIEPSQQTLTWFSFHNGAREPFSCSGAVRYLTIDQAIEHWDMVEALADASPDPAARTWLPITYDNGTLLVIENKGPNSTLVAGTDFGDLSDASFKPLAEVVQWWTQLFHIGYYPLTNEELTLNDITACETAILAMDPDMRLLA